MDNTNKIYGDVEALDDDILAIEMESGLAQLASGIIIPDDNGTNRGIRPRWCKIYKVGKNVTDVSENEMVLVEHGRWTYRQKVFVTSGEETTEIHLQKIDPNGIMMACSLDDFNENDKFASTGKAINVNQLER